MSPRAALRSLAAGVALAAAIGVALPAIAAPRHTVDGIALSGWHTISTPTFVLVSDMKADSLRALALKLAQFVEVLQKTTNTVAFEPRVPMRILVFSRIEGFEQFAREYSWPLGFMSDSDPSQWLLVTYERSEFVSTVFHEYSHYIIRNVRQPAPRWFDEGFAELVSTVLLRNGEGFVGMPPADRIEVLATDAPLLPLRVILGARTYPKRSDQMAMFYAQSWLLAHYLHTAHLFGEDELLPAMQSYGDRIGRGQRWERAFQAAFPISLEELEKRLANHRKRMTVDRLSVPVVRVAVGEPDESTWSTTSLDPAQAARLLGESQLALELENPESTERLLEKSIELDASHASAHANLAVALARQGRMKPARRALARAIELGADEVRTLNAVGEVNLLVARDDDPVDRDALAASRAAYRKLIEAQPDLPVGYAGFGRTYVGVDDDPTEGIEALRIARELHFDGASLDLARLLMRAGQLREAGRTLVAIVRWNAGTPTGDTALELLRELRERVEAQPTAP